MGRTIRVGNALGVEVAVDWSWALPFALAAWTLFATVTGRWLSRAHVACALLRAA